MKPEDPTHLWHSFQAELQEVASKPALTRLRDRYLSRQRGLLTLQLRGLGRLAPRERPLVGKSLNRIKGRIESALDERRRELEAQRRRAQLESERLDITLPGYLPPQGRSHPLTRVRREMEEIAVRMGFSVLSGPELELDHYNFEALNIPKEHPARDTQDTLYITENLLLRTHTSPVQIRTMERQAPPIRMVVPGRVYRRDTVDATHSPMFHQMEGLVVDEGITFGDLKGTLEVFLRELFSRNLKVRFRPSYFPFVEPGAEVDIECIFCSSRGCGVCKRTRWIEIMGAGMVHPQVFSMVGYDAERYTGFAWGMGIDRIAILKYRVRDLRLFFDNDLRFLRQF